MPGETVKVKDNIDTVRMLQTERGGWNDLMRKVSRTLLMYYICVCFISCKTSLFNTISLVLMYYT